MELGPTGHNNIDRDEIDTKDNTVVQVTTYVLQLPTALGSTLPLQLHRVQLSPSATSP